MPILYLHLGIPKTGTTSIQDFLFQNRTWLVQQGLVYSKVGLNPVLRCHHDLIWSLGLHKQPPGFGRVDAKEVAVQKLKLELAQHQGADFLVSSELLIFLQERTRLKEIFEIFPGYQPKLIFYLRRQDRWLESFYQQRVKDGDSRDFVTWYQRLKSSLNYYPMLRSYADLVGEKHVMIRVLEKEQLFCGELVQDFCYLLGVAAPPKSETKILNTSELGPRQLEIVRLANQGGLEGQPRLYQFLAEQGWKSKQVDLFELVGPGERKLFLDEMAPGNEQIRKEFIKDPKQCLFNQEMPAHAGVTPASELECSKLIADLARLCLQLEQKSH